jgi:prevent-host-death family protein
MLLQRVEELVEGDQLQSLQVRPNILEGQSPHVAIMDYMASLGIRELRDNLSRYVRRAEQGERIQVTANGRVVAVIGPPGAALDDPLEELIKHGNARMPLKSGSLPVTWPRLKTELPSGTAQELIDADRADKYGSWAKPIVKRAAKRRGQR